MDVPEFRTDTHLGEYVADASAPDLSMAVINASRPEPVERMVETLFERQPVEVGDVDAALDDPDEDCVVLLRDGAVVATSPLRVLEDTILFVNSDLYKTGGVDVEDVELPDVLAALTDVPFHVRGYPESHHEKMPLILISRHVVRLSYVNGGTHRASFQRLSRLRDERGTENVYGKLADAGVDTHVYGVPDWLPPRELGVKIHAGYGGDYDASWFVVHRSATATAALVAVEVGRNEWRARWTDEDDEVRAIEATIKEHL